MQRRGNRYRQNSRGRRNTDFNWRQKKNDILKDTPLDELPIHKNKQKILQKIDANQVTIIHGDTGCGKTTQVPKYILEECKRKGIEARIVVSQPRRLACITVAQRVSSEIADQAHKVGYHIRGDKSYSNDSQIIFMTNGMLIQEIVGYGNTEKLPWTHVILDEIHERSLEVDYLMLILKHTLCRRQQDLKLILMSATAESTLFQHYFSKHSIEHFEDELLTTEQQIATDWQWSTSKWGEEFKTAWSQSTSDWDQPGVQNEDSGWGKTEDAWQEGLSEWDQDGTDWSTQAKPKSKAPSASHETRAPLVQVGTKCYSVDEIYMAEIIQKISDKYTQFSMSMYDLESQYFTSANLEKAIAHVPDEMYTIAAYIILLQHDGHLYQETTPQTFLVFLPGILEINNFIDTFRELTTADMFDVIIIHSNVPQEQQQRILQAPTKRRVIISTNICESSLTIPDVRYVIDFGFSKESGYNRGTLTQTLEIYWCSRAAMRQRAGRAGRVAQGVVFRLVPEEFYQRQLSEYSKPEMQRSPLDKLILKTKQLKIGDAYMLLRRAIQPPALHDIYLAITNLKEIGAINQDDEITFIGCICSDLPCDIKVGLLCLFGHVFGCLRQSIILGAWLSQDKSIFLQFAGTVFPVNREERYAFCLRADTDGGLKSDPLLQLTVYTDWENRFGYRYFANGRFKQNLSASKDEIAWCRQNYVEAKQLKQVASSVLEFRRRFMKYGFTEYDLDMSVDYKSTEGHGLLALQLCLAWAYSGKYLRATHNEDLELQLQRIATTLEDPQSTIMIRNVNQFYCEPEVLVDMICVQLNLNPESMEVKSSGDIMLIKLLNDPTHELKRRILWLGNSSSRFRRGDFVLIFEEVTDLATQELVGKTPIRVFGRQRLSNLEFNANRKAVRDLPRQKVEGQNYTVATQIKDNKKFTLESYLVPRPEHLYSFRYEDIFTHLITQVDDQSVCSHLLTTNLPYKERIVVCWEYVDRKSYTLARQVTLLPEHPLIAQILTLIFCQYVQFRNIEDRYFGFTIEGAKTIMMDFGNLTFSGHDVQQVNEIRHLLSASLAQTRRTVDSREILQKIFDLLSKTRIPILSEKKNLPNQYYFNVISESSSTLTPSIQIDNYGNIDFSILYPLEKSSFLQNVYASKNQYLTAHVPLDIPEDPRLWSTEGLAELEKEYQKILQKRKSFVENLRQKAYKLSINEAQLS